MDPEAAWKELLHARLERDWDRAEELAEGLLNWLDKGGGPPVTVGDARLGKIWHRTIAHAICLVVLVDVKAARKHHRRA